VRDILGFTGSSHLGLQPTQDRLILNLYRLAEEVKPSRVVTGACVGVDTFVYEFFNKFYPDIPQTVVFPADRKAVGLTEDGVRAAGHTVVVMPDGTSYRQRNKKIVELSDKLAAFWTGQTRSGTFMTMNIARKAGKLTLDYVFGHGLPDDEVRSRYQDFSAEQEE